AGSTRQGQLDIPRQRISPGACVPFAQVSVFSCMQRSWPLLLLLPLSCGRGTLDLSSGSQDGVSASSDDEEQPTVDSGASSPSRDDTPDASVDVQVPPRPSSGADA